MLPPRPGVSDPKAGCAHNDGFGVGVHRFPRPSGYVILIPVKRPDIEAFDWDAGRWETGRPSRPALEIVFAADWAPIRAFDAPMARSPEAVYGDLLPILRAGDLRVVNVECPLSDVGAPAVKSGSVFRGRPAHVAALTAVPFDVALMANNHVFDFGVESFEQTRALLEAHGLRTVGAGRNAAEAQRPLRLTARGVRVGIVNFSEGEDLTAAGRGPGVFGWDPESVAAIVRRLRRGADAVIVVAHAGLEYIPFPPPYVADAFRRIADAGADLIVAHHPHVPQGIEIRNGCPICYSQGNFAFFQETDLHYRKVGFLLKAQLSGNGLHGIEIIPYRIGAAGLRRLRGGEARRFFGALRRVSMPLARPDGVERAWHGFLRHYGLRGFREEVGRLMAILAEDPPKGAAMFRNRITTMQHREHWTDFLSRVMRGHLDRAPRAFVALAEEWLTRRCRAQSDRR